MTRYRRKKLSRGDNAAAAMTSALLGIGTAAVAFYVTRILLSREPLANAGESREALPPGDEPSPEAGGHDPGS